MPEASRLSWSPRDSFRRTARVLGVAVPVPYERRRSRRSGRCSMSSGSSWPPPPSGASCAICSKPIRSGSLVVYQHGELRHVTCGSQTVRLGALEGAEEARRARLRAATLVDAAARWITRARVRRSPGHPRGRQVKPTAACPFCGHAAIVTDWRPMLPWLGVEGCLCDGFFLGAGVTQSRLTTLAPETRRTIARWITRVRASGREAWCTTDDGTGTGQLVVRTDRPDRPR